MKREPSQLGRFVGRVHRRMVGLRLLEAAGVGILLSAVIAMALVGVRIYRGEPALRIGIAVLILGALGGLAWRVPRRPGKLQAAIEADRQLELQELISSAWLVIDTGRQGLDFGEALVSMAERRCQELRPGDLVLRQLGARWWGGIGLSAALVVVMGFLSVDPIETYGGSGLMAARNGEVQRPQLEGLQRGEGAGRARHAGADHPGGDERVFEAGKAREDGEGRGEAGGSGEEATARGAGSGSGRSRQGGQRVMPAGVGEGTAGDGEVASGSGSATSSPQRGNGRGSGGVSAAQGGGAGATIESAEQTSAWQERLEMELKSRRIPDEYHALIRGYFAREPG